MLGLNQSAPTVPTIWDVGVSHARRQMMSDVPQPPLPDDEDDQDDEQGAPPAPEPEPEPEPAS